MKKILILLLLNLIFLNCKSQQVYDLCTFDKTVKDGRYYKDLHGNLDHFIGTWKNTTGNMTFKVILWKEDKENYDGYYMDGIHGDYEMIENEGQPNENILYKSKKLIGNTGKYFTPAIVIRGGDCFGSVGGVLMDNISIDSY